MRRVLRPGGRLGLYVWDYPGAWSSSTASGSAAAEVDPRGRARRGAPLRFLHAGGAPRRRLTSRRPSDIADRAGDDRDALRRFRRLWLPFTLGTGPAPGYLASLDAEARRRLEARVAERLGPGPIRLSARAWAVRNV